VRTPSLAASLAERLPLTLAGLTVLSQIAYPLTSGAVRDRLTVATVLLWCAASLSHAVISRGWRFAAGLVLFTAGVGFATEVVGTATGWPFGSYAYTSTLGPRVLAGTLALASWDLFLDPQMVQAGHWQFTGSGTGSALNGIPLSNTAGWILASFVIMLLLSRLPQQPQTPALVNDRVPLGLYLWTYASSVLAAAVFFHRPGVALVGGLVMGIPVVLLLARLRTPAAHR
jgi:putative membrane protein